MIRPIAIVAALSLAAIPVTASHPVEVSALPDGANPAGIQVDTAGNIYVVGSVEPIEPKSDDDDSDLFVAKVSSDTGELLYWSVLAGSRGDRPDALALDESGAAYVTGTTASPDFPATEGALQTTFQAGNYQAFVAKINSEGAVEYATLLGGSSNTSGWDIVVNPAGEALVTGQTVGGAFPTTPGAAVRGEDSNNRFVVKIDSSGSNLLVALRGIGGGKVAFDEMGNLYVAGETYGADPVPITDGAFQATHELRGCGGTGWVGFSCSYGYVTKLNPTGAEVIYSTFVTGSHGSSVGGLHVDAEGNVLIAGSTNSRDYPTTPGAPIENYIVRAKSPPQPIGPRPVIFPPPAAGYVTKLNSTGSALLFSTYFSGTQTDTVTDMAVSGDSIYLTGYAWSPDLPGLTGTPGQCAPAFYVARIAADGSAVTRTQLLAQAGPPRSGTYQNPQSRLAFGGTAGPFVLGQGPAVVQVDFEAAAGPMACVLDAANLFHAAAVAPGQLLSIFGQNLSSSTAVAEPSENGMLPTSLGGLTATFDGVPAPLLYVSPRQVNLQVPFEVAGRPAVTMELKTPAPNSEDGVVAGSRGFPVAARAPSVFLRPNPEPACDGTVAVFGGGYSPLVRNSDGSLNTCATPAEPGSVVTIFLNAVGVTDPALPTGAIVRPPGTPLNIPVTFASGIEFVSAFTDPGAVSGVWQLQLKIPEYARGSTVAVASVDSVPVTPGNLVIWLRRTDETGQ